MKSIQKFEHINARSLEEAVSVLQRYGKQAWVLAGGTDMVGTLRFEVLREYPQAIVNLKTIPGLDYIKEEGGMLKIGALTRLEDIAESPLVKGRYIGLAEAARRTASPHVRAMGTIGGNLCQLIRCWYFRKDDNRFDCIRKGGAMCHAVAGDTRYHSIFGAVRVATPPCTANCPAGNDMPTYLASLREEDLPQAAKVLLQTNPLGAITGRVCPHNCEKDCNRSELDEAVSIRSVERYVGDYALSQAPEFYQSPKRESGKCVAIVGSGPAGLSAAYYLRQLGYPVTVYESRPSAGGVLTYGIPAYRLPKDVVRQQVKAIESTGVQFKYNATIGKDISLEQLEREYAAVFLATGAWGERKLGIPDEDKLDMGLEFLSQVSSGQKELQAERVLVIGGGSVAMDVATTAKRLGVKTVIVASLESRGEMPALAEEVEQAEAEGIQLLPGWGPQRVILRERKLAGLELKQCTAVYNSEGKFAPVYDENKTQVVEADKVILAIGQRPELSYAQGAVQIEKGLIQVKGESQASSKAKVYAGGDATTSGPLSVVAAIGSGRRAAVAISRVLGSRRQLPDERQVEHLTRCNGDCLEKQARIEAPHRKASEYQLEQEDVLGLEKRQVKAEADRCINCGCDGVNPSDVAAALVVFEARIVTSQRTIPAEEFWVADRGLRPTALADDEIITEIQVPQPAAGTRSSFIKFALRKSIDFPIVNCAVAVETEKGVVKSARICLNAVYSNPYRAIKGEEYIQGKVISEESADAAGMAAVSEAVPLPYNKFKIQIAKTLVKRTLLACQEEK
jgi:NADPH-dependent glutamate synthase beta subunit-like oxidoreductase/CO/xanthine dehydrogenase FAD-binding subunit